MTDEQKLEKAIMVYAQLCNNLDARNWHYEKDDEKLRITCGAQGDDLPMRLIWRVDADRQLISLMSLLPCITTPEQHEDFAVALCAVNNKLAHGCFDYDLERGGIFYRMTNSFLESDIGDDMLSYMLVASFRTIDDYNDKLTMLQQNMITLEDFLAAIAD